MKNTKKLAFRGGTYSLLMTVVVLAILVVINIFVGQLPATMTQIDMSSTKLYSITSNTKVVVNNLEKDVTIYWIVQADKEDAYIENLLNKYDSLSDHIDVVKKNPDIFPTFAEQYTDETIQNNCLVVECGDKYRYISYNDIYVQEADMYSYSYTTSFDGEGAITSAIDYVVSDVLPIVYVLEGHGETAIPQTFSDQIAKENIEIKSLSLLTVDEIPEDASAIMIYSPQSDISAEEKEMLADYASNGGKLLVMAGPVENVELTNLYDILADYGVTAEEGIVVEGDRDHYAFQRPFILLPDMASDSINDSLIEKNYFPIVPLASGLNTSRAGSNVKALLTTSDDSFSKIKGFAIDTYDREEGDIDGSFAVAVSVSTNNSGMIVWYSSSYFMEDMYNAYSSGANVNLAMNSLSALIGEREALAIRSKSLNYNYLTITDTEGSMLKAVMIGILPLAYLGIGLCVFASTRRKQNEAV